MNRKAKMQTSLFMLIFSIFPRDISNSTLKGYEPWVLFLLLFNFFQVFLPNPISFSINFWPKYSSQMRCEYLNPECKCTCPSGIQSLHIPLIRESGTFAGNWATWLKSKSLLGAYWHDLALLNVHIIIEKINRAFTHTEYFSLLPLPSPADWLVRAIKTLGIWIQLVLMERCNLGVKGIHCPPILIQGLLGCRMKGAREGGEEISLIQGLLDCSMKGDREGGEEIRCLSYMQLSPDWSSRTS